MHLTIIVGRVHVVTNLRTKGVDTLPTLPIRLVVLDKSYKEKDKEEDKED